MWNVDKSVIRADVGYKSVLFNEDEKIRDEVASHISGIEYLSTYSPRSSTRVLVQLLLADRCI